MVRKHIFHLNEMIASTVFNLKRRSNDLLLGWKIKKTLSHMATLVGISDGYFFSEPASKFGWTFFNIQISEKMAEKIEKSGMMKGALGFKIGEQMTNFIGHYLETKGSNVRIKKINY